MGYYLSHICLTALPGLFRKGASCMVLYGLLLVLMISSGFAFAGGVEHAIATEGSGIVFSVSEEGSVVIRGGRISAEEGYSVRLLPGTRIKGEDEVAVSIVSREHFEELAAEVSNERREQTVKSLLAMNNGKPVESGLEIVFRNPLNIPGSPARLNRQVYHCVGLQVQVQGSPTPPVSNLITLTTTTDIHNHLVLAHVPLYFPVYSWGSRAETIRVMRS